MNWWQVVGERAGRVRWGRVLAYEGLTLGLTVAVILGWTHTGRTLSGTAGMVVLNLSMLIPGIVALVLVVGVFREPVLGTLAIRRPSGRWLLVAWLLAATVMLLSLGVGLAMPGSGFAPDLAGLASIGMKPAEIHALAGKLPQSTAGKVLGLLAQGLLTGPTVLIVSALGEELGWRGFLHRELESLGHWPRAALTGLLWGLWHLPAVFQGYAYPHHPVLGSLLLLVLTQALAPIYAWLRERSGSIFVPAMFHGTCSGTSAVAIAFVRGGDELSSGFTGVAGLIAATAVCVTVASARPSRSTA